MVLQPLLVGAVGEGISRMSNHRCQSLDGAAALAQMAEEEGGSAGSPALPRLRTRGLAQGLSHSASSSPRCHSARLATSPRSSAPTLLEHSDLSLTTNSLLEPLLEQRLGRPRRPPMPTLTGLSGMSLKDSFIPDCIRKQHHMSGS